MTEYKITRKSDGKEVYRYQADSQVIWDSWPVSDYDYTIVPPETPQTIPYNGPWKITKLAFRNRFTSNEKIAIEIAGLDNPQASMQARGLAASLRASQADLTVATFIDLKRPDTRAGVQQLEAFGLLGTGRALIILDTPPTEDELYHG